MTVKLGCVPISNIKKIKKKKSHAATPCSLPPCILNSQEHQSYIVKNGNGSQRRVTSGDASRWLEDGDLRIARWQVASKMNSIRWLQGEEL